jgi:hypothetical protein
MFTNRPAMKKEIIIPIPKNLEKTTQLENDFILIRDAVQKNLLSNNNYAISLDSNQLKSIIEVSFNRYWKTKIFSTTFPSGSNC